MSITLYHYTTIQGAHGILDGRVIHQSSAPRNARFGNGTYLTDKSPVTHTKFEIARGNWDGGRHGAWGAIQMGKTDCVFTIRINRHAVQLVDSNRRIWLFPNYDLHLDDSRVVYDWNVEMTDTYERKAYQFNVMQVSQGY